MKTNGGPFFDENGNLISFIAPRALDTWQNLGTTFFYHETQKLLWNHVSKELEIELEGFIYKAKLYLVNQPKANYVILERDGLFTCAIFNNIHSENHPIKLSSELSQIPELRIPLKLYNFVYNLIKNNIDPISGNGFDFKILPNDQLSRLNELQEGVEINQMNIDGLQVIPFKIDPES